MQAQYNTTTPSLSVSAMQMYVVVAEQKNSTQ